MSDFTTIPLEDNFNTQTVGEVSSATSAPFTLNVKTAPQFTLSSGTFYITLNAGTSKAERMEVTAVSGTALTIGTRGLPAYKGGASAQFSHGGGTSVIISDNFSVFDDIATAVATKMDKTGGTFTGEVDFSGTTIGGIRVNNLTTTQRDAISSPQNGMIIYNTTTGVHNQYIAGAWATFATGTTSNASETVAGKVELATVAEQGTAASTGGSGARLVMANDNLVKTSSGAGDENKVAVLGSTGKFADGFINFSDNLTKKSIYGNGADGSLTTSGDVTLTTDKFYTDLTVSAGDTIFTANFRIFVSGTLTIDATGTISNIGKNGNNGNNASGGTAGTGGAGVSGFTGSLPPVIAGSNGGNGGTGTTGTVGTAGTAKAKCFHVNSGVAGGAGGTSTGTARAGGAGGAGGATSDGRLNTVGQGIAEYTLAESDGTIFNVCGTCGGGGGGGSNNNVGGNWTGAGGGGSATSGGFIAIYAKTIVNNGDINVTGGVGGDGGDSTTGGGGGGGAGGNGGTILKVYESDSGSGTETIAGGAGGTAGTGGANDAVNGTTGANGVVVNVDLS